MADLKTKFLTLCAHIASFWEYYTFMTAMIIIATIVFINGIL